MIYQMTIYYGAMLNGEVIYSTKSELENCTIFPDEIDEKAFRHPIENIILHDKLNPTDFVLGYLTKEQYDNRFEKDSEKSTELTIKLNGL